MPDGGCLGGDERGLRRPGAIRHPPLRHASDISSRLGRPAGRRQSLLRRGPNDLAGD
jgi:hypothetical protein